MKKRLRVKFAVLYGLFALLSFIAVSTFTMSLTRKYETKKVADSLYQDASRIASASLIQSYTKSSSSRKDLYNFLSAAAAYQNSTIWLMDTSGNILINTSLPFEESEDPEKLPEMDPGEFTGSYYQIGTFFDYYSKDVLSVVSPVTSGDAVKGYIVIHCYLSKIERECNSVLNISYFTLLVILGLSMIPVFGFWRLISRPLDRLIYAAGKYAAGNLDYTFIKEPTDELEYIGASLQYLGRPGRKGWRIPEKIYLQHFPRFPLAPDLHQRLCGGDSRRNDSCGNPGSVPPYRPLGDGTPGKTHERSSDSEHLRR